MRSLIVSLLVVIGFASGVASGWSYARKPGADSCPAELKRRPVQVQAGAFMCRRRAA